MRPRPCTPTEWINASITDFRESVIPHLEQDAMDLVFSDIDEMFREGQFEYVDQILKEAIGKVYNETLQLSLLTITLSAKSKLPHRPAFIEWVKETQRGLLKGLE